MNHTGLWDAELTSYFPRVTHRICLYGFVEKRKISYFGLVRNLIQHWISPNQDDLSYSAQTFFSG